MRKMRPPNDAHSTPENESLRHHRPEADQGPLPCPDIPSPKDIAAGLKPYQPKSMTQEEADAHLTANVIPAAIPPSPAAPSKKEETWAEAFAWLGRICLRGVELLGEAVIAAATPLLTAMVDGIAGVAFALTVWEFWRLAKPTADSLVDRLLS